MIEIIKGSILDAKEKYIAHQCNALTNQAGGLAHYIFKKFPYADIYKDRPFPYRPMNTNFPGHCFIRGDGKENRFVINMIAQYYPGSTKYPDSLLDGMKAREGYFMKCLNQISLIENLESIAFPYSVGCGMAGGNWDHYLHMINIFASKMKISQNARVVIYDNEQT